MCRSVCFNIRSSQTLKIFHHMRGGITHQPPQTVFSNASPELVMCREGEKSSLLTEGKHFLHFYNAALYLQRNGRSIMGVGGVEQGTRGWFEENSVTVNEEADLYWWCWLTERLTDIQTTVPSPRVFSRSTMKQTMNFYSSTGEWTTFPPRT